MASSCARASTLLARSLKRSNGPIGPRVRLASPSARRFQRSEKEAPLQTQRIGNRPAELLEPVCVRLELLRPLVGIDTQRGLDRLRARVDAAEVEIAQAWRVADRRFHRAGAAGAAVD